jgi:hypothetical protein
MSRLQGDVNALQEFFFETSVTAVADFARCRRHRWRCSC